MERIDNGDPLVRKDLIEEREIFGCKSVSFQFIIENLYKSLII